MGVECAWIIKKVRSIDVSKDIEFQKQFTYFYRVRRNEDSDVKKVDFLIWGSCHSPPLFLYCEGEHPLYFRNNRLK